MMNFTFKMMNSVFKMMNFTFKMMNFALKTPLRVLAFPDNQYCEYFCIHNYVANFSRIFLLKIQTEWRIDPEK